MRSEARPRSRRGSARSPSDSFLMRPARGYRPGLTPLPSGRMRRNEDDDMREHLAALGPDALGELKRILEQKDSTYRTAVLRALTARPASADLATLIAMADTDEVVRLRLLRAIRDLGV
jgi:hypothetical protein